MRAGLAVAMGEEDNGGINGEGCAWTVLLTMHATQKYEREKAKTKGERRVKS